MPCSPTAQIGVAIANSGSAATLANTFGLITAVLGTYSLVAVAAGWDPVYFRMTYLPKLLTAVALGWHIRGGRLPTAFWPAVAIEAGGRSTSSSMPAPCSFTAFGKRRG